MNNESLINKNINNESFNIQNNYNIESLLNKK
jgi:hypothetical protein